METPDDIARRIAEGHAFEEHVLRKAEFKDESYGPPVPIETREDFRKHLVEVLENTETLCCTTYSTVNTHAQGDLFYHPKTNTLIAIPADPAYEPTAYRPEKGFTRFSLKVELAMAQEERVIQVVNSIYELRPELAAAKEQQRTKEEDEKLRADIDRRFQKERQTVLTRQTREMGRSSDPARDAARHAKELKTLEENKERDFERYKRERENARALLIERQKEEKTRQVLVEGRDLGRGRSR